MGMANDDDYDFSGVSQPGPFDIESSVLSKWRAQNDDEEDDDYSYFWPDQLPYDIEEKLREINKVHQEDETPVESDRPRKITFNSRVHMRAISMRRIPPPTETNDEDEPFDLSKYDTDESVDDVETSIAPAGKTAPAAAEPPQSAARPLPVSAAAGPSRLSAGHQPQRFTNKTAVSRVGQPGTRAATGLSTSGFTAKTGAGGAARRGFRNSQNFQLPDGPAADRLSVLSLTDDDDDDDDVNVCVVGPASSDTGYSSGSAASGHAPAPLPSVTDRETAPTSPTPASSVTLSAVTHKPAAVLASQANTSPTLKTVSKTVFASLTESEPVAVSQPEPKLASASIPTPKPASTMVLPSSPGASASMSKSTPSGASVSKSASVAANLSPPCFKSVSEIESLAAPGAVPEPEPVPFSSLPAPATLQTAASAVPAAAPQAPAAPAAAPAAPAAGRLSVAAPVSQSAESAPGRRSQSVQTPSAGAEAPAERRPAVGPSEAVDSGWPEVAAFTEPYRPSWSETPHRSPATGYTSAAEIEQNQAPTQETLLAVNNSGTTETNGCQYDAPTRSCSCHSEIGKPCCCHGDPAIASYGNGGPGKQRLTSAKSEDSAVESMEDHSSSNTADSSTEGSVANAAEPARPAAGQSYAAIHLSRRGRQHELSTSRGAARPRLARSASCSGGRRTLSPGKQPPPPAAAAATRPRSAPVRGAVSAPALGRPQPAAKRAGRQAAAQSAEPGPPPLRRRRARSQEPALTFQQWLQRHEQERQQAIQDRRNSARKRKQEANIKQEKAPQAFRVWLRKKRQQQLMEQRVQQLRQHELLAAAPPGRPQQQGDAFRQWLARKQRERAAAGPGPPQATLRSLSALYRVGGARPPTARDRPPPPPAPPHAQLQLIYAPHVSRGRRCRSAHIAGS